MWLEHNLWMATHSFIPRGMPVLPPGDGAESGELDMLDTAQELQSLRKTLKEAGRRLVFRAEVATVRNFRFLVSQVR